MHRRHSWNNLWYLHDNWYLRAENDVIKILMARINVVYEPFCKQFLQSTLQAAASSLKIIEHIRLYSWRYTPPEMRLTHALAVRNWLCRILYYRSYRVVTSRNRPWEILCCLPGRIEIVSRIYGDDATCTYVPLKYLSISSLSSRYSRSLNLHSSRGPRFQFQLVVEFFVSRNPVLSCCTFFPSVKISRLYYETLKLIAWLGKLLLLLIEWLCAFLILRLSSLR